jgi:hypothetical protein
MMTGHMHTPISASSETYQMVQEGYTQTRYVDALEQNTHRHKGDTRAWFARSSDHDAFPPVS